MTHVNCTLTAKNRDQLRKPTLGNRVWATFTFFTWHTYIHPFNGPFSGTIQVSRYQQGKTKLDFTEARDSEWQWHQLGQMPVCTSLQTDNHASTPPLSFLPAGCPSCCPTKSVKALKAQMYLGGYHSYWYYSHNVRQSPRNVRFPSRGPCRANLPIIWHYRQTHIG